MYFLLAVSSRLSAAQVIVVVVVMLCQCQIFKLKYLSSMSLIFFFFEIALYFALYTKKNVAFWTQSIQASQLYNIRQEGKD